MKTPNSIAVWIAICTSLSGTLNAIQLLQDIEGRAHIAPLDGPARQIMRVSNGNLYLTLTSIKDDKEGSGSIELFAGRFDEESLRNVAGNLSKVSAESVASDTGPAGTYIAYINTKSGQGEICVFRDAVGNPGKFVTKSNLTKDGLHVSRTVVAATKGDDSINSVAYSWRDERGGNIFLGFSPDGEEFPEAKLVVSDAQIISGPAIAVHNKYVLVDYLTRDPNVIGDAALTASRGMPVFIESWDGGKTWSEPKAVLGKNARRAPKLEVPVASEMKPSFGPLIADGGARDIGNSLAWAAEFIGARIFILSEQAVTSRDQESNEKLGRQRAFAAVISFKDLSDGPTADWNHVIASDQSRNPLGEARSAASDFHYSALPGTSLRAVSYVETTPTGNKEIVITVSKNTGKSFEHVVRFPASEIGVRGRQFSFTSSTCLKRDFRGETYLDTVALSSQDGAQPVVHSLPLQVNLKDLHPSLFNTTARWP